MNSLKKIFAVFNEKGFSYTFKKIISKILARKIDNYAQIKATISNKCGLEIGGPSGIFRHRGFIPLYNIVKELDGCNFSNRTIWEGKIDAGKTYCYLENKKGFQYISEATNLSNIPNAKYDFVISSHCLEHVANPLKAIEEWLRVLKKDAVLLIVLPNKRFTFDHKRSVTKFAHLLEDYQNNTGENDLTHLKEILELHDLNMDKPAGSKEQFQVRALKNFETRSIHHHVFDIAVLKEIYSFFNFEVILVDEKSQDLVIFGKRRNI